MPVSFLEVVARAARIDGRIIALLDAGRGQLYSGEYEISGARAQLIQEHLIAREALPDLSRAVAICTPDATLAGLSREAGLRTFELKAIPPEVNIHKVAAWAMVSRAILNLDETMTKE